MLISVMCIVSIPYFFTCKISNLEGIYHCSSLGLSSWVETVHSVFLAFVYSIVPFCIISILNVLTVTKIYSKIKFRAQHQTPQQKSSPHPISSLTVTMFAVCIVFVMTTVPGRVAHIINTIGVDTGLSKLGLIALHNLALINHSTNFLLYCLTGSVFRKTFIRMFQSARRGASQRQIQEPCLTVESQVWWCTYDKYWDSLTLYRAPFMHQADHYCVDILQRDRHDAWMQRWHSTVNHYTMYRTIHI